MTRYQVYLNPQSVVTLDQIAFDLDLTRSRILRDVVSRVAIEYAKAVAATKSFRSKGNSLLKMEGIGESSTGRIAEKVGDIYLRD
jgi:hypothetical protein